MEKTVLVTGASGGIGAAVARRFAGAGHPVALGCCGHAGRAQAVCDEILAAGGTANVYAFDVADSAAVGRAFDEIEQQLGPVEVLVNNAGIAGQKLFCDITDEEWRRMLDVNCTGAFYCSRRALPHMIREKRGSIVNVSSMWGQVGASCEVHYSAAKAALVGMTRALAKEVGPSGVRVNCVAPGAVDTAMMEGFAAADISALCEEIPLGRLGRPQEIAQAVFFLASGAAGYITGQVLGANGGMVC